MKNYVYLAMALAPMIIGISCNKRGNKQYPHLNAELNENATITNAELRAINFERYASTGVLGINTSSNPALRLSMNRAQVMLSGESIHMLLDVDVHPLLAQKWREHSSKAQRMQDCESVGIKAAVELGRQLECGPDLISISIQSATGELNIRKMQIDTRANPAPFDGEKQSN